MIKFNLLSVYSYSRCGIALYERAGGFAATALLFYFDFLLFPIFKKTIQKIIQIRLYLPTDKGDARKQITHYFFRMVNLYYNILKWKFALKAKMFFFWKNFIEIILLNMRKIPGHLEKYFWDVDFKKLNYKKYGDFIIKRILEYGDEKAVNWMFENYTRQRIKRVLCKYRGYSRKTANFWGIILGVKKSKILSLKTKSDLWQQ